MSPRVLLPLVVLVAFGVGAYAWYATNDTDLLDQIEVAKSVAKSSPEAKSNEEDEGQDRTLVSVDGQPITSADVEWEYKVHVTGITEDPELKHLGDFKVEFDGKLSPLKRRIIAGLVERKVLYGFLKRDNTFDIEDPGRYTNCLTQWQEALIVGEGQEESPPVVGDKDRLKSRLCEQSVLLQYLDERVFSQIAVSNEEIEAYYNERIETYKEPEKVKIRQILLADDREARRVRNRLKKNNFTHMAKEKSIAPEASEGGILGPFAKGEMPRVFDVAFDMRVYTISRIQKSTYGFHIIMPIKKYKARQLPLADVRDKVKAKILEIKKEKAYEELLDQALATISVKTPKSLW